MSELWWTIARHEECWVQSKSNRYLLYLDRYDLHLCQGNEENEGYIGMKKKIGDVVRLPVSVSKTWGGPQTHTKLPFRITRILPPERPYDGECIYVLDYPKKYLIRKNKPRCVYRISDTTMRLALKGDRLLILFVERQ